MKDWGQHHPAAERYTQELHHRDCGKKVSSISVFWGAGTSWRCDGCGRSWEERVMTKFSPQELGERFYVLAPVTSEGETLVEVQQGQRRYTTVVSNIEAQKPCYKKVENL